MFSYVLLSLFLLVSLATTQKDPLKDFCRIHGHQTTLVDRKLYIDGGLVNWAPLSSNSINYTSTWLRNGDLDDDNQGFPQQGLLTKNESVPSVQGGFLWPDVANKVIYQYGGEYGNEKPEDFKLWFYDIIYNTWNLSSASTTDFRRASWGAGATVQDRAEGYYYGGWLTNASVPGYTSQTALNSMIIFDMLKNTFRNQSGPADNIPRAEGVMLYVPAGDAGMLVYFGGVQLPYNNETQVAMPMTEIHIYDIANVKWYKETASGDEIPEDRRRFCAGATWAEDRSSYNIYLYGGASVGEGPGYGDVWILSLPSFRWIKFFPTEQNETGSDPSPHHSLTCDVIENAQMIIMGGHFPNHTNSCDVPPIYGQHGLDLSKANPDGAKWARFDPKLTTYKVPPEITQTIGGGSGGSATLLAPTSGFAEKDLEVQFGRAYTQATRTATRYIPPTTTAPANTETAPPSGGSSRKAVIGGAVGGVLGGLLLATALGVCIFFYRRRKNRQPEKRARPPSELPGQPMVNTNFPAMAHHKSHPSNSTTQYTHSLHSPHGSPPSDHGWSPYGQAAPGYPNSPGQVGHAPPMPQPWSPQNTGEYAYNYPSQTSPVGYPGKVPHSPGPPQEMPVVRSPIATHHPPAMDTSGIDPYFAQNPPKGAESEKRG